MKAWITRNSAFSIQCGGLERLFIHFSKPKFYYEKYSKKDRDFPLGYITEREGLFLKIGWYEHEGKMWVNKQSVGNWLGYDSELCLYIWDKLCEHFINEPIDNWHILEKEGKCKQEDFLLEIEIEIKLTST